MVSYVCLTSPICHVLNDYDYVIIWFYYFYSKMNFKSTLNLFK